MLCCGFVFEIKQFFIKRTFFVLFKQEMSRSEGRGSGFHFHLVSNWMFQSLFSPNFIFVMSSYVIKRRIQKICLYAGEWVHGKWYIIILIQFCYLALRIRISLWVLQSGSPFICLSDFLTEMSLKSRSQNKFKCPLFWSLEDISQRNLPTYENIHRCGFFERIILTAKTGTKDPSFKKKKKERNFEKSCS